MTDIVERLRLTNADFLHEEAADEIERLRRIPKHYGAPTDDPEAAIRWITGIMDIENRHLREERDRLREALLMWLSADDAGDGQECINAIAHARAVLEGAPVPYEPTGLEYRGG